MFTTLVFSKKLKYIGYAIVIVMVVIPIYVMLDSLYSGTIHMFGGETKDEKLVRLTNNEKVIDDSIKSMVKKRKVDEKVSKITTSIIVRKVKTTNTVIRTVKTVKAETHDKVKKIVKKNDDGIVSLEKPPAIVKVVDIETYEAVGAALSDGMFEMYNNLDGE